MSQPVDPAHGSRTPADVVVCLLSHRGHKIIQPLDAAGIHHRTFQFKGGITGYIKAAAGSALYLSNVRLLTGRRALVLTDSTIFIGAVALLLSVIFFCPLVYRARGDTSRECRERGRIGHLWIYRRLFLPRVRLLLPVSGMLEDRILSEPSFDGVSTVVPTPQTLLAGRSDLSQRTRTVLVVTRFDFVAKAEALIAYHEQFRIMLAQHEDIDLLICGAGPQRRNVEQAYAAEVRDGRARFAGHVATPPVYAKALVLVHISYLDAYPSVINEARAAGLPVIVSDTDGLSELVEHGEDGMILNAEDDHSLSECLTLLSNQQRWTEMSLSGRDRTSRQNSTVAVGRLLETGIDSIRVSA